jgi:hypothetical protein
MFNSTDRRGSVVYQFKDLLQEFTLNFTMNIGNPTINTNTLQSGDVFEGFGEFVTARLFMFFILLFYLILQFLILNFFLLIHHI